MPRPSIVMDTPAGRFEYPAFQDSHDVATAYRSGEISKGKTIMYQGMICDVIDEFTDETGLVFPELLAVAPLQNLSFRIQIR